MPGVPTYVTVNASSLDVPGQFSTLSLVDLYGQELAQYPLTRDKNVPSLYTAPSFMPPETFFYVQVINQTISAIPDNKNYMHVFI